MKITMQYTAQLSMEAGCATEKLEIANGTTVAQIIINRAEKHGGKFSNMLLNADGEPVSTIMWVVNGEQVDRLVPHVLQDGDELMLMSPIAGG
jgi:molybdopterin converting factor small subunit